MNRTRKENHQHLTIGEVARLAGLQTSTLRYYESIGLLHPPRRISGQRRYTREVLQILAVIRLAKEVNFSLPEIRALLHGDRSEATHLSANADQESEADTQRYKRRHGRPGRRHKAYDGEMSLMAEAGPLPRPLPTTPSERWKALAIRKLREIDEVIRRALEMKQLLEEGLQSDALEFELDQVDPLKR